MIEQNIEDVSKTLGENQKVFTSTREKSSYKRLENFEFNLKITFNNKYRNYVIEYIYSAGSQFINC
jgi:hypothetical protein